MMETKEQEINVWMKLHMEVLWHQWLELLSGKMSMKLFGVFFGEKHFSEINFN